MTTMKITIYLLTNLHSRIASRLEQILAQFTNALANLLQRVFMGSVTRVFAVFIAAIAVQYVAKTHIILSTKFQATKKGEGEFSITNH